MNISYIVESLNVNLDKIVVIGAGKCSEYPSYKKRNFKNLILLEADHRNTSVLNEISRNDGRVIVYNKAISSTVKEVGEIYLYDIETFTGFYTLDKLKELYPNVISVGQESVDVESYTHFINKLKIDNSKNNLLVIDINGSEGEIFAEINLDDLNVFSHVLIRCTPANFFDNRHNGLEEVTNFFDSRDINYLVFPDLEPPYLSIFVTFERENIKNSFRLAELTSRISVLKGENEALASDAGQMDIYRQNLTELEFEKRKLTESIKQLQEKNRELLLLQERDTEEIAAVRLSIENVRAENSSLLNDITALNSENERQSASIADLETKLEDAAARVKEETHWHQKNKSWAESLQQENSTLKETISNYEKEIIDLNESKESLLKQKAELDFRQQKLDLEVAKVEVQLELIKDVVLREKAF